MYLIPGKIFTFAHMHVCIWHHVYIQCCLQKEDIDGFLRLTMDSETNNVYCECNLGLMVKGGSSLVEMIIRIIVKHWEQWLAFNKPLTVLIMCGASEVKCPALILFSHDSRCENFYRDPGIILTCDSAWETLILVKAKWGHLPIALKGPTEGGKESLCLLTFECDAQLRVIVSASGVVMWLQKVG